MIESGLFTRSTFKASNEIEIEIQQQLIGHPVKSGAMFHLINSYIYSIFSNTNDEILFKQRYVFEFGRKTGFNLVQEQCMGFIKYCAAKSQKNQKKQFVGQMKLLNNKIWGTLCGSKGKLFSITIQNVKASNSYKIQDKQFILGKSVKHSNNPIEIQYRKLLLQFVRGAVFGSLEKLRLQGQVNLNETPQGEVYAQIKNLTRVVNISKYSQYTSSIRDTESQMSSQK